MFEDNTHFKMDILGLDVSLFDNEYKTQEQDFALLVINIELISLFATDLHPKLNTDIVTTKNRNPVSHIT